jgi:hypothetical protein
MAHYGELLDAYEPEKDALYGYFDDYFNHPTMVKIKNVKNLSVYMTKTYCLLTNECRYIVVFVPQDYNSVGTKQELKSLSWLSIQTRTLSDNHDLPSHDHQPRAIGPLNKKIVRIKKTKLASTYRCEGLPLTVTLLHTKDDTDSEYQQYGNVVSALETYQTIVTIN